MVGTPQGAAAPPSPAPIHPNPTGWVPGLVGCQQDPVGCTGVWGAVPDPPHIPQKGLTTRSCCTTPPSASCPAAGAWAPFASWRRCRYWGALGRMGGTRDPAVGSPGSVPAPVGSLAGRLHPRAAERWLGAALLRGDRLEQSRRGGQREAAPAGTGAGSCPVLGTRFFLGGLTPEVTPRVPIF